MSSINTIQGTNYTSYVNTTAEAASTSSKQNTVTEESAASSATSAAESVGVVYEKSEDKVISETKDGKVTEKNTDRSAIIKQMQNDLNTRKQQLLDIVRKSMNQQGNTFRLANSDDDSIWSVFANGNFTVSEAAKAQAQEDISEDGYWGVKQTSDRIVEFAKTLANNDSSKAGELLDAFKKGYQQATSAWGKELPDISSQTYDAVVEKFDQWMNGESEVA